MSRYSRFEREFHAVHGHYPRRPRATVSAEVRTGTQPTIGFALLIGSLGLFWSIVLAVVVLAGAYVATCFVAAAFGL